MRASARANVKLGLALLVVTTACGPPVGVRRADPEDVQRALTRSILSAGELSGPTEIVLHRYDLADTWEDEPEEALEALHGSLAGLGDSDEIFALAELSFARADAERDPRWYLATVVYALAFLMPGPGGEAPSVFDPRFRTACDLYNRGLTNALVAADRRRLNEGYWIAELPFGRMGVTVDQQSFLWGGYVLRNFVPVAELEVTGLRNRYRSPGLGAAFAADVERLPGTEPHVPPLLPGLKVPVTAVLDVGTTREALVAGRLEGRLVVHAPSEEETVEIAGRLVPLETEPTSSLAAGLAESPLWSQEITGFLASTVTRENTRLTASAPYKPGLVPVVLVHGTASSPARWAEMLNDLVDDPRLRGRIQVWFFQYDTGNPILYSAHLLRRALADAVQQLDPAGVDPALRRMVVIGHSQGGLLTKMTAIDSGDRFWKIASDEPFESLDLPPERRETIREMIFIEPLPFVERAVFIATPHRGSYLAGWGISRFFGSLVSMPGDMLRVTQDLVAASPELKAAKRLDRIPNAVDNMAPHEPFIVTLGSIPVEPPVIAHSIIAVASDGPPEEGDDGVVEYTSAHIDEAVSELVVRSGHSVQSNPHAIEEVRRILLEHLDAKGISP